MLCLFYVIGITIQSKKATTSRVQLFFFYLGRDLQSAELNQTTNTISCYEYKYLNRVFPISLHFDFPNENDFFINFSSIPNSKIPSVLLNLS